MAYATATEDELRQGKKAITPGAVLQVQVIRGGERLEIPITAGEIPRSVLAQWVGTHLLDQHKHQFEVADTN